MKKALIVGMVMSFFGCAFTTEDYYYLSLEGFDGAKIVAKKKLQIEKLRGNSEIPTEYLILRKEYSLSLLISDKSYFPNFKVSINGLGNTNFVLKPKRNVSVVSDAGIICASYYLDQKNSSKMDFAWSTGCLSGDIKKEMSFDVIDSFGNIVASENIPFVLIKDGKYTLLDAL